MQAACVPAVAAAAAPAGNNGTSAFGGGSADLFGGASSDNNQWGSAGGGGGGGGGYSSSGEAGGGWAWQKDSGDVANGRKSVTSPPVNPFTGKNKGQKASKMFWKITLEFTGTSNLTQLNTSPWPTTGTSPVNTGNAGAANGQQQQWPGASQQQSQWPMGGSNGSGGFGNSSSNSSNPWPGSSGSGGASQPEQSQDPFSTSNLQSGKSENNERK